MSRSGRLIDGAIAGALAAATAALWKARIIGEATEPFRHLSPNMDLYTQIYPMAFRASEWIRAGEIPLWNPYQTCGHPFLATGIHGVLYPLNLLYLLLPTASAMEATIVLHMVLCAVFMYAFARAIDLSRFGAVAAAIIFAWSGFMVMEASWFTPALATGAWLPLALLAVEKTVRGPRLTGAAVLALAIGLAFLAGWPQTWVYSMYTIGIYSVARLVSEYGMHRDRARLLAATGLLALGGVLGACLMAAQFVPSLELQRLSPRREGGLTAEQALVFSPFSASWLPTEALDPRPEHATAPYVGLATLLLMAVSPFSRVRRAQLVCFWVLAIFSIGVALGVGSPLYWLHRSLPGLAWFRAPQRVLYLYAISAAILGAMGLEALRSAEGRRTPAVMLAVLGCLTAALSWLATALLQNVYLITGMVLAGAVACVPSPRRVRLGLSLALVGLLSWDLFHAARNHWLHPYHDLQVLDRERGLLDFVKAHQGYDRTYMDQIYDLPAAMAKQGTLREIYGVIEYEPLTLSRYDRFFQLLESPETQRKPIYTFTGDFLADPAAPRFGLIDLMSVRYYLTHGSATTTQSSLERHGAKWRRVDAPAAGGNFVLYENTDTLPRAYVAHAAKWVPGEDEALDAIAAPGFNPRAQVVLEGGAGGAAAPAEERPVTPARLARYGPRDVVVECDNPAPGYLVLTDTFYPGWRATVDGEPSPIYQANFLFRAVPIDAGRHTIAFHYAPTSFWLGAGSSLAAIAIILLLFVYDWMRGRRQPKPRTTQEAARAAIEETDGIRS